MPNLRDAFVARFGEHEATVMEAALKYHQAQGQILPDKRVGSDPFAFAVVHCIGWECFTRDSFRQEHGFTVPAEELKSWLIEHGNLADYDGEPDWLAALAGCYDEYVGRKPS